jgi:hypothetical protein
MDDLTRRVALGATGLAAAVALAGLTPTPARADDKLTAEENEKLDRQRVIACGFTEAEADAWVAVSRAAARLLELPKLHVMDDHELSHAIHILQYRLMSRPAYRKYRTPPKDEKK